MNEFEFEVNLITSITEHKLGLPVNSLNVKEKTEQLVLGRMVVCNILMFGGVTPTKLSDYFCKHRTNFYHYKKLHTLYFDNLAMYPEYVRLFNQVMQDYEDRSVSPRFKGKLVKLSVIDDIDLTIAELNKQKKLLTINN
tara:strand:+ start:2918 stop:3334 length:417 start_codon:yes stop_codon:yes gene_type:complete